MSSGSNLARRLPAFEKLLLLLVVKKLLLFLLRKKTFTVLTLKWVSLLPVKAVKVKTLYDGDVHDVGLNKGP